MRPQAPFTFAAPAAALCALTLAAVTSLHAATFELETLPQDPAFTRFKIRKAPSPPAPALAPGRRIAVCGDSITELRCYTRIVESYFAACHPELDLDLRQFGWSGESAPGLLSRLTNDVLRFHPNVVTVHYGMNDHGYQPFSPAAAIPFRNALESIVTSFKNSGATVHVVSPTCLSLRPPWAKHPQATEETLNLALNEFRSLSLDIATRHNAPFCDVFLPMLRTSIEGRKRFGPRFSVGGTDGVHPGWSGGLIIAHSLLQSLGAPPDLATINVDLANSQATASPGHEILGFREGGLRIRSSRYPFCTFKDPQVFDSPTEVMSLIPFQRDLGRFTLIVRGIPTPTCRLIWGTEGRSFPTAELERGINLAEAFPSNPFTEPFRRVDQAVVAKQLYETRQVKSLLHGDEGRADMEATVQLTEKVRANYVAAVRESVQPVEHLLLFRPE